MHISDKWKAVVGGLGALAIVATDVVADNVVNADEGATLLVHVIELVATIYAVWRVPNREVTARRTEGR